MFKKEKEDKTQIENFKKTVEDSLSFYEMTVIDLIKKRPFFHIIVLVLFLCQIGRYQRYGELAFTANTMFYINIFVFFIYAIYLLFKRDTFYRKERALAKQLNIDLNTNLLNVKAFDTQGEYANMLETDMLAIKKAKKRFELNKIIFIAYYSILLIVFVITMSFPKDKAQVLNEQSLIIQEQHKDFINYKKELKLLPSIPDELNEIVSIENNSTPIMEMKFKTKSPEEYDGYAVFELDYGFQIFINNINIVPKKALTKEECNAVLSLKINLCNIDKDTIKDAVFYISDSNKKEYLSNLLSNKPINNVAFQTDTILHYIYLNDIKSNAEYYMYTTK